MRAGHLNERVSLLKAVKTESARGEVTQTWQVVATFWAHVIPLTGKEVIDRHAVLNIQGYKVRYRPRKDVSVDDRLQWSGVVLDIETRPTHPNARRDEHNIICKEVVNDSV